MDLSLRHGESGQKAFHDQIRALHEKNTIKEVGVKETYMKNDFMCDNIIFIIIPEVISVPAYIWIIVFAVMLIIEGLAPGLVSVWFAAGALVAFVLNLCGVDLIWQIIAFIFSSAGFVALIRPWAKRFIHDRKTATNADAFLRQEGIVIQDIDTIKGTGQVKIKGQVWTARSVDNSSIPVGTLVRSVRIEGAKLIVEELSSTQTNP